MTDDQRVPAPAPPESRAKRIVEWFSRGAALREKRSSASQLGARANLLAQRARCSADLALNTKELARSADAERTAEADSGEAARLIRANASEFYRQSSYWSLCSLAAASDESAGASYVEAIWDTLEEKQLTDAAPGERSEALRTALRAGSFVYFAGLPESEQAALSEELRRLAEGLLREVDLPIRALQEVLLQRAWRLSLILVAVLFAVGGVVWERRTREERSDLALGAPWRASSKWENVGCTSPDQQCPDNSSLFFHTKEEKNPWIEFDLGKERQVSAVQAENRTDCCTERTIPLVIEVSENHKKWRSVARRDVEFKTWRATFTPVKARWVRLRVDRVSYLHLARVRIFP